MFGPCSEQVLGVTHSSGLHDPGPVRWPLAVCLLVAWIVIFLCMLKGIRSSGKVSGGQGAGFASMGLLERVSPAAEGRGTPCAGEAGGFCVCVL